MIPLRHIIIPLIGTLLVSAFSVANASNVCVPESAEVLPIEVSWRTFAPEKRFEQPHYIVPSIPDYVTVEESLGYASDAVTLAVLLVQTQGGKGREPYIDNYVRGSLSTAFSLLVAYQWNTGFSMSGIVDSLTDLAYAWLPQDPHKRIGGETQFYERFDPEYHKRAALEVEKLCREAVVNGDPEGIYCALESALSTAVVAVTGSEDKADLFVKELSAYTIPCGAEGLCPVDALPFFADNRTYPNGTFPEVPYALTYEEAYSDPRLFPLSKEQTERGLAYYFERLHDGVPFYETQSLGGRIMSLAGDPARLKKLSSTASNTGKFVAGYSLYCEAAVKAGQEASTSEAGKDALPPIAAFSGGSKVPVVLGLTLVNRLVAAVSAGMKFWESYDTWIKAMDDQEVAARFEKSRQALDLTLDSLAEEMERLKDHIAAKAKDGQWRDSMALVDEYEDALRSYNYLKERKDAAERDALAAFAGLEAANTHLEDAQWRGLSMSATGGLDALARLLSSVTKLSLKGALSAGWIVEKSATAGRILPDALERISPGLATILITTNIVLGLGEAYDMYNVQVAANSVLSLPEVTLDPELRAALSAAQNQNWSAWGASLIFDVLKDARNVIAAMVSWGIVEFFAHHSGWVPEVSMAKSIMTIWSLTLINAVIPTYWKWSEETESEEEKLYQQDLLDGIRDGLAGGGESPKYHETYRGTADTISAMGRIADKALVNAMVVSQLLHELIEHDSRYAAFIMLDRYRDGDPDVADFFKAVGLSQEQLDSLSLAPSELWNTFLGEEDTFRDSLRGIEARSINFLEGRL